MLGNVPNFRQFDFSIDFRQTFHNRVDFGVENDFAVSFLDI